MVVFCSLLINSAALKNASPLNEELNILSALLQDENFVAQIVAAGDTHKSYQQDTHSSTNEVLQRSFKEEKIAISLAPFYALECGIQALMQTNPEHSFFYWVDHLLNRRLHPDQVLLLNRFANATWKAGQPFRDLARIKRRNFISAALLPAEEVAKDFDQLHAAAEMIHPVLLPYKNSDHLLQLQKVEHVLQDRNFAEVMAAHVNAAYYIAQQQMVPAFLQAGEEHAMIAKNTQSEKMAMALSGFYALECGLSYLASRQQVKPSVLLHSICEGALPGNEQMLFQRFAHATFKAGEVFMGMHRITTPAFGLFDFLEDAAVRLHWAHIKTVASQLKKYL